MFGKSDGSSASSVDVSRRDFRAMIIFPSRTLLAEDPSPLPDILSHRMNLVVRNQVKFCVTSITKLVYDVM